MYKEKTGFSSGIPSLDETLQGIWAGDNIVLQVDDLQDYIPFVNRFCKHAVESGNTLVYFRFAEHPSLLPDGVQAECYYLNPQKGFEHFITEIFTVIERYGKGIYYLFDCLSGLAVDWYTDRMLGNFFMLTCPYLYKYDTVTYFALLRNLHRPFAINAIHNTAQVVFDIFRSNGTLYILPVKVLNRYSPTMYMLHSWEDDLFHPVTKSAILSEILSNTTQPSIDFNTERKDTWANIFVQAQKIDQEFLRTGELPENATALKTQLIKMIITRDEHLIRLCEKYFDISDLIAIGKRMIGSGLIGGKSLGMLLARKILIGGEEKFSTRLEMHDSFFIGSDVFYTYVIQNDCWWERYYLKRTAHLFEDAKLIQKKLLAGKFSSDILEQFQEMLNYFGQSPIIVRSSSLLEDAYGNAFAGKYDSVFCANQGTPAQRLTDFIKAVQTVYASTMSERALAYRLHRGLLNQDEQMALLVQRVSGEFHDHLYFPQIGGVGYSFNPFVWHRKIDPSQGMLRLVFGLGTRAVDCHDDDYTRVVALNQPLLRPEGTSATIRRYSQKIVNVIDLEENDHVSYTFEDVVKNAGEMPLDLFASRDTEMEEQAKRFKTQVFSYILNFQKLLTKTSFVKDMKEVLSQLARAYKHPVDIEFTVNFLDDTDYRINVVQCRPFQFVGKLQSLQLPQNIPPDNIILKTNGPIVGQSVAEQIERIIYIVPEKYGAMPLSERYTIARFIGKITNLEDQQRHIMLIGPGRWGTKMPELGIPVSFSEIQNVSVLCEVAKMHEGLTPDLSLGTHFFNDIVEMNILYMGVSPGKDGSILNEALLKQVPNKFSELFPENETWAEAILVVDTPDICSDSCVLLHADTLTQEGVVFLSREK